MRLLRGHTRPIREPHGVASLERVPLGGVEQWVLVRGRNVANPVLLFLHGGPGMPAMFLAHRFQGPLERHFVVVHWDRRGAGKSYSAGRDPAAASVRRLLDDAYELTDILRQRFGVEKLLLLGHSWGTYLGMLAAFEEPELFSAYVGTGQIAGSEAEVAAEQRRFVLDASRAAGEDQVVRRVSESGVRESDLFRYGGELRKAKSMRPLLLAGLGAPEYTVKDVRNVARGAADLQRRMQYDAGDERLETAVRELRIPVFFLLGRHDHTTPSGLAEKYLRTLEAPLKKLVWFEHSAHFPFMEEPDRFANELRAASECARLATDRTV